MKVFGVRKFITAIWAVLIALTFSAVGMTVSNIIDGLSKQPTKTPAEVNAADLTISNLSELQTFANSVNDGNSYSGKTVVLSADIDCGGAGVGIGDGNGDGNYFKGVFDGCGYTISNVKYTSYYEKVKSYNLAINQQTCKAYSLFPRMSGTIKNLQVKNVGRYTDSDEDGAISGDNTIALYTTYKFVGGLIGYAEHASIENCSIENFRVETTDDTSAINVGGLFAVGNATCKNIHVKLMDIESCAKTAGIGPCDNPFVIDSPFSSDVGSGNYYYFFSSNKDYIKIDSCVLQSNVVKGNNNYVYNCLNSTTTNCHTTEKTTTGLTCSSVGGEYDLTATDETQTPWYYGADDYNNGYPYLRIFIKDWTYIQIQNVYKKIKLKLDNVEQESHIELLVPPEVETFSPTTTSTILNICNRTIEAYSLNANRYKAVGFTFVSSPYLRYLARYEDITNNLTLNWCDNVTMKLNGIEVTETQVLKLFGDEEITIEYTELSKKGSYSTITFTITDSIANTTREVTYTAHALYCLTGHDLTVTKLTENTVVNVICVQKTYSPNFG